MQRVSVVGNAGSGKTTFARRLSSFLGCPHIELDALHWGPNWTPIPLKAFREQLETELIAEAWIVDGNYRKVRDLVWSRADTVVWLDFSLVVIMGRLVRRTAQRTMRREELWNRNRERLRDHLLSRDSLFLWALQTHRRRQREFREWLRAPEYAQLTLVHLTSPRDAEKWLIECAG